MELAESEEQILQDENATRNNIRKDDEYNPLPEIPIEQVVRKMADNISTIKSIMVFFVWLWGIGVALSIILLLLRL